jgi:hypothetical protein
MPRLWYATPLDMLRRFDPQLSQTALDNSGWIGFNDEETAIARLEGVQQDFERDARPFREVTTGHGSGSYRYKSAKGRGFPIHVYLDHFDVVPFDASAGDRIERRTGRDSWIDITNEEGSSWVADYRTGTITLYELPGRGHLPMLRRYRDRFIRLSYRHGAPGGRHDAGGQTTLAASLSGSQTGTYDVADAGRLPPGGGTMLLGGTEYVSVDSVDTAADTVTIGRRGLRGTDESNGWESGDVLHYCPMNVREAVAAMAAREAVLFDDWTDQLVDTGGGAPQPQAKLDDWEREYDHAVARYSDNGGYR